MKVLFLSCFIVFSSGITYGQCNPFFSLKKGAKWEVKSFTSKGKPQGSGIYEVKSLSGSDESYEAIIDFQIMDKKGKEVMNNELEIKCEGGTFHYDMRRFIPQQSIEAYSKMNIDVTGDNLEYPSSLSVGDQLKDGKVKMSISGNGLPFNIDFTLEITDRKVESQEKVTTTAGTFDCYKVTSLTSTKAIRSVKTKSVEYIAPGKGVVRTESYNQSGKMVSYSEMVSYTE